MRAPTPEIITPEVITFGCRLNSYESEVMRAHAEAAGLADTIIINTCAVTAEAERQARQTIRKLRRNRPTAKIIVTGCAAQINPESYANMAEVDHLIDNHAKLQADTFSDLSQRIVLQDIQQVRETSSHLVAGFEGRARAFVQVQNGCDHRCTFCIIPFGRGPSRSVPIGTIVAQLQQLVAQGYAEVVLTGVDMTSYGHDLPGQPKLGQMVRRVLALVPQLPRLRLSSIDPAEIDEDLWHLIEHEPRLLPHLHLSVQAGDDLVLKRMKRRHSRDDVLRVSARAHQLRPDLVLGADIIAGFPTESDAMFENTLALVREANLTWLHVFPYSARAGTPAAKMPQVPMPVRKGRAAALRAAGAQQVANYLAQQVGTTQTIVIEQDSDKLTTGRTGGFATVQLADVAPAGALRAAKIVAATNDTLQGELVA